jgi:propanol-preferring alcohol dehydrogenase
MPVTQPHAGLTPKPERDDKRRSQRLLVRIAVDVSATGTGGKPFTEPAHTLVVNAHGGLIELKTEPDETRPIVLRNRNNNLQQPSRIVWVRRSSPESLHVGVEFDQANARFWNVEFPPEDWGLVTPMRAAVLRAFDGKLSAANVVRPFPRADEVVVRVEACGICHSDLHMARGEWPDVAKKMVLPAILGHEFVGRVVAKGSDVKEHDIGARVGVGWLSHTCGECEFCATGAENICLKRQVTSVAIPGGYAEYARIKASHAVPVPLSLPAEQAAPLFCAGLTVFHALSNAGSFAGLDVAVFGIGGLGHLAVQLARLGGAEVIAVDVHPAKLNLAMQLGASQALDARLPDVAKQLRADGGPYVAIVTAASKAAYDLAFKTIRRRGTIVVVGLPKEDLTFFADDLVVSECKIIGSAVGTRSEMHELLALADAGKVRCEVETCTLDQVGEIYERMERGDILGRAVIKI